MTGLLWWAMAERLSLINDEGIYLEGARRILHGQVPYRDFFVLTGPGSFWLHALLFRLLGVSLSHGHLLLILDVAFLAAAVFWLLAHLKGRTAAAVVTFLFVAFGTANPSILTLSHRWESSALAMASVVALFAALKRPHWWLWTSAGVFAAWAAWTTPTLLAVVLALAAGLLADRNRRRSLFPYAAGAFFGSAGPLALLASQGALAPMVRHLLWSAAHYTVANDVSYGAIIGGYSGILKGATGLELAGRVAILLVIAIPVYLPLVNFAGASWRLWRTRSTQSLERRRTRLLAAALAGLWFSAYPWFLGHLTCVAALSYVLGAALFWQAMCRVRFGVLLSLSLLAATFLWSTVQRPPDAIETAAGRVRATADGVALYQAVAQHVQAGDSLFVFPHKPIVYFLSGATNPTRYTFLQPGMMSDEDETRALADLESRPPRWIFYEDIPAAAYLRIWPRSDPQRLRMRRIEEFIRSRYRTVGEFKSGSGGFEIRELRAPEAPPAGRP